MASLDELRAQARQLLCAYALTSVTSSRAFITTSSRRAGSSMPTGTSSHPAAWWADELERVESSTPIGVGELERLVEALHDELELVRRRPLAAVGHVETIDDLDEQIVSRGEGFTPDEIAVALRCLPRQVRRARLIAGRDAERGRLVALNGNGSRVDHGVELVAVGMSIRQAAIAAGVARSTLHDHARRAPSA